ncbi:hypothetical protein G9F72_024010 [Clostridium estertheticum]|uniref:hypothetical protein n=1 Tax=Clostridium estertheticum TaxID=238834 RepID=UPI0013E95018|nr:hypothetical protein [Clostridium estertheticum]MBZ9689366.1 hypothetical protein [Clostridium estertheticum]
MINDEEAEIYNTQSSKFNGRWIIIMVDIRDKDKIKFAEKRKKTTCPNGLLKSHELVLRLLRGYYQIYNS